MAVPKRRTSTYRRGKRRANKTLTMPQLTKCSNPACGKQTIPHQMCQACGFYKGKLVNPTKTK